MVKVKNNNVKLDGLHPLLREFIEDMSAMFTGIVVTSGLDGVHMVGSRHYIGKGLDIGANSSERNAYRNFKAYLKANKDAVKAKYQLEDILDEGTHIHVELPLTIEERKVAERKKYTLYGVVLIISAAIIFYKLKIKKQ